MFRLPWCVVTSGAQRLVATGLGVLFVAAALSSTARAGTPVCTPEIDPGVMSGALALLVGGVMLVKDRVKRK